MKIGKKIWFHHSPCLWSGLWIGSLVAASAPRNQSQTNRFPLNHGVIEGVPYSEYTRWYIAKYSINPTSVHITRWSRFMKPSACAALKDPTSAVLVVRNSRCRGYITEKFFRCLAQHMIAHGHHCSSARGFCNMISCTISSDWQKVGWTPCFIIFRQKGGWTILHIFWKSVHPNLPHSRKGRIMNPLSFWLFPQGEKGISGGKVQAVCKVLLAGGSVPSFWNL